MPEYDIPLDTVARNGFIQFTSMTITLYTGVEEFV
jgi:hypothetical protein